MTSTTTEGVALRVVATAGHVDHGKSSLIVRLTGIDPDRWAEEKRRGLTIDLGYAWTELPGGREIGFVDVPGHERFIGNMLAGVGPVRLVLFVVAADEGWKPQSEEHLQILDVLGVSGGVIALTKRDLVDDETLAMAHDEVAEHVAGTALDGAPIVPVSARTGEGIEELTSALAAMVDAAPVPARSRARLFVDRVFTITGAGTVVTGTLEGDRLTVGDEVELFPHGQVARIRSLQTHKRSEEHADPVARVAANLVGAEKSRIDRGDVLARPGAWRPVTLFDATLTPVRGIDRVPGRGAFKVYTGAAEADATIRQAGDGSARIRLRRPLVLQPGDRFVVREAGRRATVGGGAVLDVAPPRRFGDERHLGFLARRRDADPAELPALAIAEHRALPVAEVERTTGMPAPADLVVGGWAVDPSARREAHDALTTAMAAHHAAAPLEEGAPLADARAALRDAIGAEPALADALIDGDPDVVRSATTVRLATHTVALDARTEDVDRLLAAIGGAREPTPPTVKELVAEGIDAAVIDAAGRQGVVVRLSPDLVVTASLADRARAFVDAHAADGVTVSALREHLGTSRRYAVPLAEWMDAQGITRRRGDLRFPREVSARPR
jgi:selenocysteine-specific elongation factor